MSETHERLSDPVPGTGEVPEHHNGHDAYEGHSVAMFRDRFRLSLALTIPGCLL